MSTETPSNSDDEFLLSVDSYPEYCPHCGERLQHPENLEEEGLTRNQIYRRHRRVHVGTTPSEPTGTYLMEDDRDHPLLPDDCVFDTKTFRLEQHYTATSIVTVEAATEAEAKEIAKFDIDDDPEIQERVHVRTDTIDGPDQASIEYLKKHGLLDEDWDKDLDEPTISRNTPLTDYETT